MFFLFPVREVFIFLACCVSSLNLLARLDPIPENEVLTTPVNPKVFCTELGLDSKLLDDEKLYSFPQLFKERLQKWQKTFKDVKNSEDVLKLIHRNSDWQHECCVLKTLNILLDAAVHKELSLKDNEIYLNIMLNETETSLAIPRDWQTNKKFLKAFLHKMLLVYESIQKDDTSYGLFGLGFYREPPRKPRIFCESPS